MTSQIIESEPITEKKEISNSIVANANNYTTIKTIIDSLPSEISNQKQDEHNLAIIPPPKRTKAIASVDEIAKEPTKSSISRIGEKTLAGAYESDEILHRVIQLTKTADKNKIKKLPAM